MRVVVAGAGMAGLRSAEAIRKAGFGGELTIAGAEPHMPYNRPPLSKDGIGAAFDAAALPFRVARAATGLDWRLGQPAVAADLAARTVTLADGSVLGWDGLVVATGVRSRRLSLPGPRAGRHAIRTLDDLTALRPELAAARRIVVVGGGFIGSEVAAASRVRGLDVTVIEPEPLPMRRPLGDELAAELLRRHEQRGVRFRLGTVPVAFEGGEEDRVRAVALSDGTSLDADLVIESVGSVPNTEWLDGNGLDLADGVACDGRLRVLAGGDARDDVVAAGDVARYPHPLLFGASRRIEHWTVATDSGKYAAAGPGPRPVSRSVRRPDRRRRIRVRSHVLERPVRAAHPVLRRHRPARRPHPRGGPGGRGRRRLPPRRAAGRRRADRPRRPVRALPRPDRRHHPRPHPGRQHRAVASVHHDA